MSWKQLLFSVLKHGGQIPAIDRFLGESGQSRARAVLLRCPLVAGDETIVDSLLSVGETQLFRKGEDIIIQDAIDDDSVFFILFGDANVFVDGKLREDIQRSAPVTVGEMATKDPTQKRSATIRVASEQLVAFKVPGSELRKLAKKNDAFRELLLEDIGRRGREAIAATGAARRAGGWRWTVISAIVGFLAGAVMWWVFAINDASFTVCTIVSPVTALTVFVIVLLSDPAFRYFRLGMLCVGALLLNEALKWQVQGTFMGFEFSYELSPATQGCQAMDFIMPLILGALSAYLFWIDTKVR